MSLVTQATINLPDELASSATAYGDHDLGVVHLSDPTGSILVHGTPAQMERFACQLLEAAATIRHEHQQRTAKTLAVAV